MGNINGEVDRNITVSGEDCDNVRNYSLHFGVEITETLKKAMDVFEKEPTFESMLDFKRELCKWLVECGHESFTDDLWKHPTEAAMDILYDLQFDKEVQDLLTNSTDEQNKLDKD
jgi:hypothetical protein